jgi:predicted transcriptional regulator
MGVSTSRNPLQRLIVLFYRDLSSGKFEFPNARNGQFAGNRRMATLTIRMPDDAHERLKVLAKARKLSVNKLIEQLSVAAIAEFDVETRFLIRAARGKPAAALKLLEKIDRSETRGARGKAA